MNIIDENEVDKIKEIKTISFWRFLSIVGAIGIISFLASAVLAIQHWPGSGLSSIVAIAIFSSFCFGVGFFADYEEKYSYMKLMMVLLGIIFSVLTMIRNNIAVIIVYVIVNLIFLVFYYFFLKNRQVKF
jgi:hypothetical protein